MICLKHSWKAIHPYQKIGTCAAIKSQLVAACALAGLIIGLVGNTRAQTPVNGAGWYGYEGGHPFTEGNSWGLLLQGYIKRNDVITDNMALFGRIGLNRELANGNSIAVGYAVQYNYPYDAASLPYKWWDNRIWEQFVWNHHFGSGKRYVLTQRFRMEQSWEQRKSPPDYVEEAGWEFENIFRYQLKVNVRVNQTVSLSFYDEVHLLAPPPTADRIIDQNRAYAGLVFNLDQKGRWQLETGYMNQKYYNSSETQEGLKRINHTLSVTLVLSVPFRTR